MATDSSSKGAGPEITRREALTSIVGLGLAATLPGCSSIGGRTDAPSETSQLVRRENEKPGTRDWMLRKTAIDPKTKYRCPWIEGYCSHTSVRAGETIRFFVSTNPASPFRIELYRMGFYGGSGGRRVA